VTGTERLLVAPGAEEFREAAAREFLAIAAAAIHARGRFAVALSGGNTPRGVYERIAATWREAPDDPLEWSRVHLFWGDERYVPHDHPESNYRMAREALISRVPIPPGNVRPVPTDLPDPREAAARYEATLREFFGPPPGAAEGGGAGEGASTGPGAAAPPRFDLVLLGLGADGHTASLFPGTGAPDVTDRLATAVHVAKLDAWRITLTLPLLNHAANVIFLVTGADKAAILRAIIEGPATDPPYPARRVRPAGSLLWIADRAAAPWAP